MIQGLDQAKLLTQVREEYSTGYSYVRSKRIQYRERMLKYDMQRKDKNKINIHLIANTIDTLIGVSWSGEGLTQKFVSREGFIGQDKASKLNYVAKFDSQQDHYQQLFYQNEQDRYFYGLGIMVKLNFDEITNSPNFVSVNPNSFIPDPWPSQNGRFGIENYRYCGFMLQSSFFDLRDNELISKDALYNLGQKLGKFSSDTYLDKIAQAGQGNYIYLSVDNVKENFTTEVYYHFTTFNGKKYLVCTDVEQSILFYAKEILPVFKNEKKNNNCIKFPVAITHYEPLRGDPFGKSICDRLEDKQDAISILFNLNIIKAKKEALGGDFLVNSRLIKNRQDLTKPTVDSRFIVADTLPGESLGNAMMEVPRSQIKVDSINMIQALYEQTSLDTGVDKLQQGIVADRNVTATESQTIQANANIKSILKNNIASWGYKAFWHLWYREYCEKFTAADEKFVVLNNDFERTALSLKRHDFISEEDPYIEVGTTADIEAIDNRKLQMMQLEAPQFLQSSAPEISKMLFKRDLYRLMGWTENTINKYLGPTPSERKAKEYLELVNMDIKPKSLFAIPGLDLYTVYLYLQMADDTEAKRATLRVLDKALIDQGLGGQTMNPMEQQLMGQPQGGGAANAASGIQMAQSVQAQQPSSLSRGQALPTNPNPVGAM